VSDGKHSLSGQEPSPDKCISRVNLSSGIRQEFELLFGRIREDASLEVLQQVAERFALIPYENISKILQIQQISDPESRLRLPRQLLSDFARWQSGGTCFSLTYCLRCILEESDFSVRTHMADLGSGTNNHCALVVDWNNFSYLIDPGYLITSPLLIPDQGSVIHETRLNPVRLEKNPMDGAYYLSTLEPEGEKFRYKLHPESVTQTDFFDYWKDSFSWGMMHSLVITKVTEEGRLYVHDRYYRMITRDGKHGKKIKDNLDITMSDISGISLDLIRRARLFLADSKPKLRGN
jgi:arylamine N-acetyltransferase